MKQPNVLLKLAAVVSSLLLVGGFVSYRAGAFNWLLGTSARPEEAASEQPPPDTAQPAQTIMYSSKWGVFVAPSPPSTPSEQAPAPSQQPAAGTTQPAPAIMSGSKSFLDAGYRLTLELSELLDAPPPAPSQPPLPSP
jgi:hypothetical protein